MILDQKITQWLDFILGRLQAGDSIFVNELEASAGVLSLDDIVCILQSIEYPLEFDKGKGLLRANKQALPSLSKTAIRQNLTELSVGLDIQLHHLASSTNDILLAQDYSENSKYQIALADAQHAGRGRQSKNWISPFGKSIYFSIGFYLDDVKGLELLPQRIALVLKKLLLEHGVKEVGFKWPNDILVEGKKLAGILIETKVRGGRIYAVIGIGLNLFRSERLAAGVDQEVAFLEDIVPLVDICKNDIVADLIRYLFEALKLKQQSKAVVAEWSSADVLKGREVEIIEGQALVTGTALGIADDGSYLIETEGGMVSINSSYVSLRAMT